MTAQNPYLDEDGNPIATTIPEALPEEEPVDVLTPVAPPPSEGGSSSQRLAETILALLPLAIGASFGGKKGAHAGAIGTLGAQGYLDTERRRDEDMAFKTAQFDKQNQAIRSRSILTNSMANRRQQLNRDETFENQRSLVELREKLKGGSNLELSADLQAAVLSATGKNVTNKKEADLALKAKQVEIGSGNLQVLQSGEGRRKAAQAAQFAAAKVPGFEVMPGYQPDPKSVAIMSNAAASLNEINGQIRDFQKMIDAHGGDVTFFGQGGKENAQLQSFLTKSNALLQGMGANFTVPEMGIVKGMLPDSKTFLDKITANVLGRNTQESLASYSRLINDLIANRAVGYDMVKVGYNYKPGQLPVDVEGQYSRDKNGGVVPTNWYNDALLGGTVYNPSSTSRAPYVGTAASQQPVPVPGLTVGGTIPGLPGKVMSYTKVE